MHTSEEGKAFVKLESKSFLSVSDIFLCSSEAGLSKLWVGRKRVLSIWFSGHSEEFLFILPLEASPQEVSVNFQLAFWTSFCLYFPSPRVKGRFACVCSDRDWIQAACVLGMHSPSKLYFQLQMPCFLPPSFHGIHLSSITVSSFLPPQQSGPKLCREKLFYSHIPTKRDTSVHLSPNCQAGNVSLHFLMKCGLCIRR